MRLRFLLLFVAAVAALSLFASPARVALVIGNSEYGPGNRIPAAAADRADIAFELDELKFTVIEKKDTSKADLLAAIAEFKTALGTEGAEGVVYYSGHGATFGRHNYLIPVDMPTDISPDEFPGHAVPTSAIYQALVDSRARIGVVLLDACRTSVFHRGAVLPGLQKPEGDDASSRIVTGFADQPGAAVAVSVDGEHSSYAKAILEHIGTPGLSLEDFFIAVGNSVEGFRTRQVPWQSSAQRAQFFFRQPIYLEVWGDEADDDLIVTAGLDTYIRSVDGPSKRMRLLPGRNIVTAAVVNFRSKSGGDLLPEGWHYTLRTNIVNGPVGPRFSAEEPEGPVPRSRWGRTFVVARMAVIVGQRSVQFDDDPEETIWLDEFSILRSPGDTLYEAVRWAVVTRGVPLYDNSTEDTKRAPAVLRENVTRAHTLAGKDLERLGLRQVRHSEVTSLVSLTGDVELEEVARRVRGSVSRDVIANHLRASCTGIRRELCATYRRQSQWPSIRALYFDQQRGNSDARHLLGLLSNRELRDLYDGVFGSGN